MKVGDLETRGNGLLSKDIEIIIGIKEYQPKEFDIKIIYFGSFRFLRYVHIVY